MAKRANPTLIGAFVLGGLTLVVAGILLLGGREWFKRPVTCLMAFDQSVAGLTVGSPVSLRGVQLGTVTSIETRRGSPYVVVLTQIDPARARGLPGAIAAQGLKAIVDDAVRRGLRAQLQVLSFLTGQLYIALDFYPNTPVRLTGIADETCEIPTIPTALAQLQDQLKRIMAVLEQMPLKEIAESTARTLDGIEQLVRGPELRRAATSLDAALLEARTLLQKANSRFDPTAAALQRTLEQAQRSIDAAGKLVDDVDRQVNPLTTNVESTLDSARALMLDAQRSLQRIDEQLVPALTALRAAADAARDTLRTVDTSLGGVDGVLAGQSPIGYQLVDTLNELSRAARALRILAEEINRQPTMLLFGRGETGPP
jgi:paraquat-inducible protein B